MSEIESHSSLLEASTEIFNKGLEAFKKRELSQAKKFMEDALRVNPYDIGAMIILSLLDSKFQKEEGLFSSEEHRRAFSEITKSPHVINMYQVGNNFILQLVAHLGLTELNLVDIGIGTATQEMHLLKRLGEATTVKKVKIIGVEPMQEMSAIALQNLQSPQIKDTNIDVEYENIQAVGQNIPKQSIRDIQQRVVDVVLATISIHHATKDEKRKTLQAIKAMRPKFFVLADVNSNHESDLEAFSDELVDNVRRFYSLTYQTLCEWSDEHFPNRSDIKAAFKKFNFDEARNILTREYPTVRDYHTTADRWRELLKEEGFKIVNPSSIGGITNGIEGTTEIVDDTIYMLITEGRKLFFAIIAQPIEESSNEN